MITPTIGRKVWFFFAANTPEQDATVIDVHNDRSVTLFVVSRGGTPAVHRHVTLVQEGDPVPEEAHAMWMPYQVGQAKKDAIVSAEPPIEPPAPAAVDVAPPAQPTEVIAEAPASASSESAPAAPPPADDAHVEVGSTLFSDPEKIKE